MDKSLPIPMVDTAGDLCSVKAKISAIEANTKTDVMSRIYSYSCNNESPSAEETASFMIHRATLEKAIDDANELQRRLSAHKEALDFALSPIRRIPNELLGYIFECCVAAESFRCPDMHPASSPWLLACVCRKWRTVSTTISGLWSAFNILGARRTRLEKRTSAVVRMLNLSKQQPLDIEFGRDVYCHNDQFEMDIITLLSESAVASRIRSLVISSVPRVIRAMSSAVLPSLEKLDIDLARSNADAEQESLEPIAFNDVPNLRRYKEDDYHDSREINLPWAQLTHIQLGYRRCVYVEKLRDVEVLILGGRDLQFAGSRPGRPVVLPRLRCLEVAQVHPGQLANKRILPRIFEGFNMPNLEELKIRIIALELNNSMTALFAGVSRITSFTLGYWPGASPDVNFQGKSDRVLDVLRSMPQLLFLQIEAVYYGHDVARVMVGLADNVPTIAPKLAQLRFPDSTLYEPGPGMDALCKLVSSRMATPGAAPLREVRLYIGMDAIAIPIGKRESRIHEIDPALRFGAASKVEDWF